MPRVALGIGKKDLSGKAAIISKHARLAGEIITPVHDKIEFFESVWQMFFS